MIKTPPPTIAPVNIPFNKKDPIVFINNPLWVAWLQTGYDIQSRTVAGPFTSVINNLAAFDSVDGTSIKDVGMTANSTGTGNIVRANGAAITSANLTSSTINKVTITSPAVSSTLTVANGTTLTGNQDVSNNASPTFANLTVGTVNKVAITAPAVNASLVVANGTTLTGNQDVSNTASPSFANVTTTNNVTAGTGFGCNSKSAQTAYASGGALGAYADGTHGLDTAANMSNLHALVVKMRTALVNNGIMS